MNMKRPFITTLFAMLLVLFTVSCSSEDKEFDYAALPMSAQLFVKQYLLMHHTAVWKRRKIMAFGNMKYCSVMALKWSLMRRESGRVLSANTLRSL